MEPENIKDYITENLDQISDELLREIAQSIHDYHLDQASQEIQALNLTEFTHEQLAQLAGVPVELIKEKSKPWVDRRTGKVSSRPGQIIGSLSVTALYTGKRQDRKLEMRCWFDETKQRWIEGTFLTKRLYTSEKTTTPNHSPNHTQDNRTLPGQDRGGLYFISKVL